LVLSEFGKSVRLGTRTGGITYGDGQCWLTWNEGPSAQPDPRDRWIQIVLRSPSCGTSKRLAVRLISLLDGPPPAGPAPQTPLLLKPSDPDSDRPGACADLEFTQVKVPCELYVPVPPPKGAVEAYRQGRNDGNVVCSISHDAVRRVLGTGFRPVVEGAVCVYVEQTNALQVRIGLADRNAGEGVAPRKVELAGRQVLISTGLQNVNTKEVSLRAEDATGVVLQIHFTMRRPRGGGELDTGRETKVEPLAQRILEQYF
jgi:hypothetical protein